MKIICVGRNYIQHAAELNNPVPSEPVIFIKPDSALVTNEKPFFIPPFSSDIHHEVELVVKICKVGKNIAPRFAHRYYDEITVGIDFTARDLQAKLKSNGLPWTLAKGFDGSAPVGRFVPCASLSPTNQIRFRLEKNGEVVQSGVSGEMLFSIDTIVAFVSKYFTLKTGDLIFTGTPAGVGPVKEGDTLCAFIGDERLLTCNVR